MVTTSTFRQYSGKMNTLYEDNLLSNMGEKAIKSHATGQKHKAACQLKSQSSISYFLKKKGSEAATAESYAAPSTSHLQDIGTDVAKPQPSYDIPPGEVKSSTSVKPLTDYVLRKEERQKYFGH